MPWGGFPRRAIRTFRRLTRLTVSQQPLSMLLVRPRRGITRTVLQKRGRSVTHTDEAGNSWTNTTDALGRLVQVVEPGAPGTTTYTYNALDALTTVLQCTAGTTRNRSFTYDGVARRSRPQIPKRVLCATGPGLGVRWCGRLPEWLRRKRQSSGEDGRARCNDGLLLRRARSHDLQIQRFGSAHILRTMERTLPATPSLGRHLE